jgi:hypothetical protein
MRNAVIANAVNETLFDRLLTNDIAEKHGVKLQNSALGIGALGEM